MEEHRLSHWAEKAESFRKLLMNVIWVTVVIVAIAVVGRYVLAKRAEMTGTLHPGTKSIEKQIPWSEVDKAVAEALTAARTETGVFASNRVGGWTDQLMVRVDQDFLPWYFEYWNQQVMGFKALWHEGVHFFIESHPDSAEQLTAEVQREFAKRVLRPQIAQMEMERIVRETMDFYVATIRKNIEEIPARYEIPKPVWERYIDDIAVMTSGVEGNRQVPVSLKTLYLSGAGGAGLLAIKIKELIERLLLKIHTKSGGTVAAEMATRSAGKVAIKTGCKWLGPIIGIGIIVWDFIDHHQTKAENLPILRQSIADYLAEMQDSVLHDTDAGIMTTIAAWEREMVKAI